MMRLPSRAGKPVFSKQFSGVHTSLQPRMRDENDECARSAFGEFFSHNRILILIVLGLALTLRIVLAISFPLPAGDESRYTVPAINMLAGHGFSVDTSEP